MTTELIQAIEAERHRQNALHPVAFSTLLPAGDASGSFAKAGSVQKREQSVGSTWGT